MILKIPYWTWRTNIGIIAFESPGFRIHVFSRLSTIHYCRYIFWVEIYQIHQLYPVKSKQDSQFSNFFFTNCYSHCFCKYSTIEAHIGSYDYKCVMLLASHSESTFQVVHLHYMIDTSRCRVHVFFHPVVKT